MINVNMTPNPYDIQTLHCSQGDEGREFEIKLHNNGEVLDTSNVKEPIVYPVYKGGTEQILPSSAMNAKVDLGTLTWGNYTHTDEGADLFRANVSGRRYGDGVYGYSPEHKFWGSGTLADVRAGLSNGELGYQTTNAYMWIRMDGITNITDLVSAISGHILYYESLTASVPMTSSLLADIRYPDGLRTDQEFLYRECPSEKDGQAKIKSIKGNTIKWNQLTVFPTVGTSTIKGVTFTNNNDGSWTVNGTPSSGSSELAVQTGSQRIQTIAGHKYLIKGCPQGGGQTRYQLIAWGNNAQTQIGVDDGAGVIINATESTANIALYLMVRSGYTATNLKFYPQAFDLTMMFGAGNEPTTVEEFTSLFPLSYYSYNQGELISFNGSGIKTTGKNLFSNSIVQGAVYTTGTETSSTTTRCKTAGYVRVLPNTTYTISVKNTCYVMNHVDYDGGQNILTSSENFATNSNVQTFTTSANCHYVRFMFCNVPSTANLSPEDVEEVQLEVGSSATSFEPYTEHITSLPISTYFPTGMKSIIGTDVYDELVENKAITRTKSLTFTSFSGAFGATNNGFAVYMSISDGNHSEIAVCNRFEYKNYAYAYGDMPVWTFAGGSGAKTTFSFILPSTITSLSEANAWASENPITVIYKLETPTEEAITTASLVSEYGEIPLKAEGDHLVGECTSELSSEAGFHDLKVKLSDEDGDVYSNKIQLHVERRP